MHVMFNGLYEPYTLCLSCHSNTERFCLQRPQRVDCLILRWH